MTEWRKRSYKDWHGIEHTSHHLVVGGYSVLISFATGSEFYLCSIMELRTPSRKLEKEFTVERKPLEGHHKEVQVDKTLQDLQEIAEKWLFDIVNEDFCNAKACLMIMSPDKKVGDWGLESHKPFKRD